MPMQREFYSQAVSTYCNCMNKDRFERTPNRPLTLSTQRLSTARCVDNSQHRTKVSIFFLPAEPSRTKRV